MAMLGDDWQEQRTPCRYHKIAREIKEVKEQKLQSRTGLSITNSSSSNFATSSTAQLLVSSCWFCGYTFPTSKGFDESREYILWNMKNASAGVDGAAFEEAREVGLGNEDGTALTATKYGDFDADTGEEITVPTALVLKTPSGKKVVEECDVRLVYCRSLIANISTIRDILHDAFDEVRSGDLQFTGVKSAKLDTLLAINEHVAKHPRAPSWAPYTYSDASDTSVEKELGVIPSFEILHRHGDTAHLVQWIVHRTRTRPIDHVLEQDAQLYNLAESMVSLVESIRFARTQWKRMNGRIAALQKHPLGRGLTSLQVQRIWRKSHEKHNGKLGRAGDIVTAEADRLADAYTRLDKLLHRADVVKAGILRAIEKPEFTSNFLVELKERVLEDELVSGLRRHRPTHHGAQTDLESTRIDDTFKAACEILWNTSSEITFRHKTSRRFEQFPHADAWFEVAQCYITAEIDYLREKASEALDAESSRLAETQELYQDAKSFHENMEQVSASLQLAPDNLMLQQELQDLMGVSQELDERIQMDDETLPFGSKLKEAATSIFYDLLLINRLVTLCQNPPSGPYENLGGELCRDIIEMTLTAEENILEAFELIPLLSQEEQKTHLATQASIWSRFSASKWNNQLSDAELSRPQSWEEIRRKANTQQRLATRFLAGVQASIQYGDYDQNTWALDDLLSGNKHSKYLHLETSQSHLAGKKVEVQPVGPIVEPISSRPWAFSRLYRFFTSPDIGPKFDTPPLEHGVQCPWHEPRSTFLAKVNALVRDPISELEMREFLQTCHRRRLLFVHCCRLHVVGKVERGWGAINSSPVNKEEMPRKNAPPEPSKQHARLFAMFNQCRTQGDLALYFERDFSVEHVLDMVNRLNIAGHPMTAPEFAAFYKTCDARAELFLTRAAGRITRINNGWDNSGKASDPPSMQEFVTTAWQYQQVLGIMDRGGSIVRDFGEQSVVLWHRWNRAVDTRATERTGMPGRAV